MSPEWATGHGNYRYYRFFENKGLLKQAIVDDCTKRARKTAP